MVRNVIHSYTRYHIRTSARVYFRVCSKVNIMSKKIVAIGAGLASVGAMFVPFFAHAAADATIVNAATDTATALKENAVGSLVAALPIIVLIGALVLGIRITWRFARGMAR